MKIVQAILAISYEVRLACEFTTHPASLFNPIPRRTQTEREGVSALCTSGYSPTHPRQVAKEERELLGRLLARHTKKEVERRTRILTKEKWFPQSP